MRDVKNLTLILAIVLFSRALPAGQSASPNPSASEPGYSGMYSFLKEGEFVQLTIEDDGRLTGFVSRYGDGESDQGAFLDQFFKKGKIDGINLSFTTDTVHGVWYEFKGTAERGNGKSLTEEGYYVLKGTLTEYRTDADKKTSSKAREVLLKSFPREDSTDPGKK